MKIHADEEVHPGAFLVPLLHSSTSETRLQWCAIISIITPFIWIKQQLNCG